MSGAPSEIFRRAGRPGQKNVYQLPGSGHRDGKGIGRDEKVQTRWKILK
jgi:hypothetical protein